MVSVLISRSNGTGLGGHYVVFLGKTLYSQSASLHHKWVSANLMLGGGGALGSYQAFTYLTYIFNFPG